MSASPEDQIVALLSRWLARHVDTARLREELGAAPLNGLSPEQAAAVDELLAELTRTRPEGRGGLERVVRETLEALALD